MSKREERGDDGRDVIASERPPGKMRKMDEGKEGRARAKVDMGHDDATVVLPLTPNLQGRQKYKPPKSKS